MCYQVLCREYAAEGIRANAICPGQIYTELNKARFEREAAEQGIFFEVSRPPWSKLSPMVGWELRKA